ncbi:MAG: M48 family metalloprotease [Thermoprotei archaeon]
MGFSLQLRYLALFTVLTLFLLAVGYIVSYALGVPPMGILVTMFGISIIMNLVSYYWGPQMLLRVARVRLVQPSEYPAIYTLLEEVSQQAGIPTPKLGIVNQPQPNAFATGRGKNNSYVVVTSGLLKIMDRDELKAVLGHEVGHIVHRDMALTTAASTVATAITYMVDILFFSLLFGGGRRDGAGGLGLFTVLLAPIAASMVQLAISRSREFYADEAGAKLTGRPDWLISALRKIDEYVKRGAPLNVSPTTSSMWIANPFRGGLEDLFSTHPSTEKRVKRLQELARKEGLIIA